MKKISAIVLAIALVLMASVPFCASADETTTFSAEQTQIATGTEEFTLTLNYETTAKIGSGKVAISYPADQVTPVLPEDIDDEDAIAEISSLGSMVVVTPPTDEDASVGITFVSMSSIKTSDTLANLTFKVTNPSEEQEIEFTVTALEWIDADDSDLDYAEDADVSSTVVVNVVKPDKSELQAAVDEAIADLSTYTEESAAAYTTALEAAKAVLDDENATQADIDAALAALTAAAEALEVAPTTTEAPATTTEAPATTTTVTTTAAASATGEATPWALLATVTVAGAALVVLSTKKRK